MHIFYLHGFASSPDSGKARYLRERLGQLGLALHVPDLNEPEFSSLTVTRMMDQVDRVLAALQPGPVVLIGSSLGAFVALHVAARRQSRPGDPHPVDRLILLAPALDFASDRDHHLSADEVSEWRRTGWRDVFHHASGRTMPVHFGLYEDGRRYDTLASRVTVPMLVFQGARDSVVDPRAAIAFAAARPNVSLRMLDDDHQLQGHLDQIWSESAAFLDLERR